MRDLNQNIDPDHRAEAGTPQPQGRRTSVTTVHPEAVGHVAVGSLRRQRATPRGVHRQIVAGLPDGVPSHHDRRARTTVALSRVGHPHFSPRLCPVSGNRGVRRANAATRAPTRPRDLRSRGMSRKRRPRIETRRVIPGLRPRFPAFQLLSLQWAGAFVSRKEIQPVEGEAEFSEAVSSDGPVSARCRPNT